LSESGQLQTQTVLFTSIQWDKGTFEVLKQFTNSCTEVVGKEPTLDALVLSLAAPDAPRALDVLAPRQTQTAPTTVIPINNFYQIFILHRSIRLRYHLHLDN